MFISFLLTYLPMNMKQCSETSAYKIQTPGNYSEGSTQHLESGENLKSTLIIVINFGIRGTQQCVCVCVCVRETTEQLQTLYDTTPLA